MPQTQVQLPDGTTHTYDFPDGATRAQIDEFLNAQHGATSVADQARASLAARGLTPEAVKSGHGITSPDDFHVHGNNADSEDFTPGRVLSNVVGGAGKMVKGLIPSPPNNLLEAITTTPIGNPLADSYHALKAAHDRYGEELARGSSTTKAVGKAVVSALPFGRQALDLTRPLDAVAQNHPPTADDRTAQDEAIGDVGGQALLAKGAEHVPIPGPKSPEPLAISKAMGGGYDTARGIDMNKVLTESGKPVDMQAMKANPSKGLVDHFESLLDHQNKLAEAKLAGPDGQTQIRASDLKAMAPKEVAEVGSTDARVRKAVNNWYQAAIDKATTPEGGVTIQSLDQIKRQLQGRTSYEKMFGNLNADPLRDATTADYARQLDHIGDEYVPGYKEINDRRAALSDTYKKSILPIADVHATTSAPSMIHGVGQMVGGAASTMIPGVGKGGGVARVARGAAEIVGRGSSTIDPMNVAKVINKQVARGQAAGMPGWFNEPIPGSDLPTPPAELQPTLRDRFSAVGSDGPPATPLIGRGADMAAGPGADGQPTVIDLKHGDAASQRQLTDNPADRGTRSITSGQNIADPATVTLNDGRTQVRVADPNRLTIDDLAAEADRRAGERIFQNQQRTAIGADSLRRFKDARATGGNLTDALRVENMHSGTMPRIRDFQPGESTVRPDARPVNDATVNGNGGGIVDPIAKHSYVGDESETAFMPPDVKAPTPVNAPPHDPIHLMNILRGVSSAPGELYPSLQQSEASAAAGQLGGPAAGQPAIPNTATVGTADHLTSALAKPSIAESHTSALSLSHPASLDPDVQAAILSGTAEYVDPRGRVIRIPAPDLLPH